MTGCRLAVPGGANVRDADHYGVGVQGRELATEHAPQVFNLVDGLQRRRSKLTSLLNLGLAPRPPEDNAGNYRASPCRWKAHTDPEYLHAQHYRVTGMSGTVIAQVGNRQVGNRISDRYKVLERLGGGAGGQVYRVEDEHLRTEVALKLFEPQSGQPATWDEAQALKELQSQYLLPVYNADIASGTDIRYITMPVMDGDLESASAPFGVDIAKAVRWGQQLGHGLERVHAAGLLHRDVKPGNAFVDTGNNVLLGDLGFAARMDADGYTAANGTYATVAPEVLSTGKCSVASDVYSLAATMFYLLSGQYPNGPIALGRDARRERILHGQFDKLRDVAPYVSQGLGNVVERGLSLDPVARPSSAQALANQFAQCSRPHRPWRRVTPHDGHDQCFEGGATNKAKAVSVCAVQDARGRYSVEVRHETGRRARQHEKSGIQRDSLPAALRTVLRNV